jgi:hypothetical protein
MLRRRAAGRGCGVLLGRRTVFRRGPGRRRGVLFGHGVVGQRVGFPRRLTRWSVLLRRSLASLGKGMRGFGWRSGGRLRMILFRPIRLAAIRLGTIRLGLAGRSTVGSRAVRFCPVGFCAIGFLAIGPRLIWDCLTGLRPARFGAVHGSGS